jgi:excisionase family DNA binding protein
VRANIIAELLYFLLSEVLLVNGYVRPEEIAKRWNVSVRQIQILCKNGKINGAVKFGTLWAIPEDAVKPTRTVPVKPGPKPPKKSD